MTTWLTRAALVALVAGAAAAQSPSPFGSFRHDATLPIEIAADSLEVQEANQRAVFRGDVRAGQGDLRLNAEELEVAYGGGADGAAADGTGEIRSLKARGDVIITNGAETAEGDWAEYDVANGLIEMGGGVTLTQGDNVLRGATLNVDLNTGVGGVGGGDGRVESIFTPSSAGE